MSPARETRTILLDRSNYADFYAWRSVAPLTLNGATITLQVVVVVLLVPAIIVTAVVAMVVVTVAALNSESVSPRF